MTKLKDYPDVLNISDLCNILRIGKRSAYKLLRDNMIPYRKIGRIYKIPKTGVEKFLASGNQK